MLGMPVSFGLILTSSLGIIYLLSLDQLITVGGSVFFVNIAKYPYSVIPMFILLGQLGYYSGLLSDIFKTARLWLGHLPGGLAISVVGASTIFAAASGSSVAACAVIGKASIPVTKEAGYSDEISTGVVAASGTLAALIPPSILICIYGLLVEESIGKLLIGGIIPGIVSAIIYMLFIVARSRGMPRTKEEVSWRQRLYSIRYLWVVAVLILAIMGGIYQGVCTPSEGGAVGAFVMLLLTIIARKLNFGIFWQSVRSTILLAGMVFILICGASLFSTFLVISGFTKELTAFISSLPLPRGGIFLIITAVYFTLGCFMGATGMMVVTLPIFYPLMMELGFDSIWFGIIVVKYCEMALITPPVGVNLYVVKSIAPDIPIGSIIRGAAPFLTMDLLTIGVFYFFPQIVTFLPSLM